VPALDASAATNSSDVVPPLASAASATTSAGAKGNDRARSTTVRVTLVTAVRSSHDDVRRAETRDVGPQPALIGAAGGWLAGDVDLAQRDIRDGQPVQGGGRAVAHDGRYVKAGQGGTNSEQVTLPAVRLLPRPHQVGAALQGGPLAPSSPSPDLVVDQSGGQRLRSEDEGRGLCGSAHPGSFSGGRHGQAGFRSVVDPSRGCGRRSARSSAAVHVLQHGQRA
jgi:hypothetical protein